MQSAYWEDSCVTDFNNLKNYIKMSKKDCFIKMTEFAKSYGCNFDDGTGEIDIEALKIAHRETFTDESAILDSISFPWEYHFKERQFASVAEYYQVEDELDQTLVYPLPLVDDILIGTKIGSEDDIAYMNEFLAALQEESDVNGFRDITGGSNGRLSLQEWLEACESDTDGLDALREATRGTPNLEKYGDFDSIFERMKKTNQFQWVKIEIDQLKFLSSCKLFMAPTQIMCDRAPWSFTDTIPQITDGISCDVYFVKLYAEVGCDFVAGDGVLDIEAVKLQISGTDNPLSDAMQDESFDWNFLLNERVYKSWSEYEKMLEDPVQFLSY